DRRANAARIHAAAAPPVRGLKRARSDLGIDEASGIGLLALLRFARIVRLRLGLLFEVGEDDLADALQHHRAAAIARELLGEELGHPLRDRDVVAALAGAGDEVLERELELLRARPALVIALRERLIDDRREP